MIQKEVSCPDVFLNPNLIYKVIFLLATCIFYFEILSTVQMGFVVTQGFCMLAVGLAVLGQSLATSLLSLPRVHAWVNRKKAVLHWLPLVLSVSMLFSFWISCLIKNSTNGVVLPLLGKGTQLLFTKYYAALLSSTPWMGFVLLVPHFIFGLLNTSLFLHLSEENYHRGYFFDLAGGALGCMLGFIGLEYLPYLWTIGIPVVGSAFICRLLAKGNKPNLWLLPGTILILTIAFLGVSRLEPKPQTDLLVRNYSGEKVTQELWSGWTSYTHSSLVKGTAPNGENTGYWLAHGNGESNGWIQQYNPSADVKKWSQSGNILQSKLVNAIGPPDSVLVLFAGLGVDMLGIDAINKGNTEITGVELNSRLIEGASSVLSHYNLSKFFALDRIHMKWTEARVFLEGDLQNYDRILISWNGATWAYYTGVMGPTTQTMYSEEGFKVLLRHLKSSGMLIVLNMTKINLLHGIHIIFDQLGKKDPSRAVVILYDPDTPGSKATLDWDQDRLLVKPDGFTPQDVENIENAVKSENLKIAIAPGRPVAPGYEGHAEMLSTSDLGATVKKLESRTGTRMTISTDDCPFAFDRFLSSNYLNSKFWLDVFSPSAAERSYRQYSLYFIFILGIFAIALILGPLKTGFSHGKAGEIGYHLHYFAITGIGFMCIEVGLLQKMSLLLGNPGFAISIVLANFIFSCGLGSMASGLPKGTERWSMRTLITAFLIWVFLFLLVEKRVIAWALPHSLPLRILVALILLSPGGFLLGHFFPRGLKRAGQNDPSYVPWAWTINGSLGVIASAVTPVLSQSIGFRNVLVLGGLLYFTLLFNRKHVEGLTP